MDYIFFYKTSDGVRHKDKISAPTRDEAFVILRKRGIRPIKVIAGDGSKENGEPSKRSIKSKGAVVVLSISLIVALSYIATNQKSDTKQHTASILSTRARRGIESNIIDIKPGDRVAKARPRKQLSKQITNPEPFFLHESEAFLARYAQPGREVEHMEFSDEMKDDLLDALDDVIVVTQEDSREIAELKHIVAGLKEEAALILGGGKSIDDLIDWFEERQKMEVAYRKRILEGNSSKTEKEKMLSALSLPIE